MRYRPKRDNYASGEYGEIDYQERLERYCTYLENKISKLSQHDVWGGRNIRAVLRRGAKEVSSKDLVALSNKLNFVLSDVMGQLCPHCQSCEVDYIHDFTMEKECYKCGKSWA